MLRGRWISFGLRDAATRGLQGDFAEAAKDMDK